MENDITRKEYWDDRQKNLQVRRTKECAIESEWAAATYKEIKFSDNSPKKMIEFGCNPGHSTLALLHYLDFEASGVDFNKHDRSFKNNVLENQKKIGKVYNCDVRKFVPEEKFDLVFSCGFVEHFNDYVDIIKLHTIPVKENGYVLIVVPNFKKIQWLYHALFDAKDLSNHNLKSMNPKEIEKALTGEGFEVVKSGYAGYLRFWNYSQEGGFFKRFLIKLVSKLVRTLSLLIGRIIKKESSLFSPWVYVLAKKKS